MILYGRGLFILVTGILMPLLASCDKKKVTYNGDRAGVLRKFELPGEVSLEMVYIPAGTFMLGSPSLEVGRWEDEGPQHTVTISQGFWLGKYEVTQGQWEAVMGTRPWLDGFIVSNANHPAVGISWTDVQLFIHTLNAAEGGTIYRLPTEAEWEYACRAGTTTRWSFGDRIIELSEYAWFEEDNLDLLQRVGRKKPNPWGLYDMHGNVAEWVQDWYASYQNVVQLDPAGPWGGSHRIFRGGSIRSPAQHTRSAFRDRRSPEWGSNWIGVRLLRTDR